MAAARDVDVVGLPDILSRTDLIPGLLVAGAGTSGFLIADNGMLGLKFLNAIFVVAGYAVGAALTALGLFMTYGALFPAVAV